MIDPTAPDYKNTPISSSRPYYHYNHTFDATNKPAVTLITVLERFSPSFTETVRSVLVQSCQNFEWIIVEPENLQSEDKIQIRQLVSDPRIQILNSPGFDQQMDVFKMAVKEAEAEYIFWISVGSLLEATFVEKCIWFLDSHPEYSFCNSYAVSFGSYETLYSGTLEKGTVFDQKARIFPGTIIRRDVQVGIQENNQFTLSNPFDPTYWHELIRRGYFGYTIPEYLIWYQRQETAINLINRKNFKLSPLKRANSVTSKPAFSSFQEPYQTIELTQPYCNQLGKQGKRILMLFTWMEMGGADKFNLDLMAQLTANNYEITVCTTLPSTNRWLTEFAKITPDIFSLHDFLKQIDFPRFLLYLIESRQIDIVLNSHSYIGYQLLPLLRAYYPDITYVTYDHIEEPEWKNGGYPRATVGYQDLLDLCIVSTHHLKNWMIQRGGEPTRIEVCHTNIDPDYWNPAKFDQTMLRQTLNIKDDTPLLLYAGRMVDQKRPQIFAEVIRRLANEQNQNFVCIVAGDGEYLPFLKRFVRKHNLQNYVQFLGSVSLDRMKELFTATDIFFLPSKNEGLSLALYEALAMEAVPVCADVGGQKELVTAECGYLIPHSDHEIEDYVMVLNQLLNSPGQRQAMAKAGRERVLNYFTLNLMGSRMIKLLNHAEILAQTKLRPIISKGFALECTTAALEVIRLEEVVGYLWGNKKMPIDIQGIFQGDRRAIKNLLINIASKPGLHWLFKYRQHVKKFLD